MLGVYFCIAVFSQPFAAFISVKAPTVKASRLTQATSVLTAIRQSPLLSSTFAKTIKAFTVTNSAVDNSVLLDKTTNPAPVSQDRESAYSRSTPVSIDVAFEQAGSIEIGAPVVFQGRKLGEVSAIAESSCEKLAKNSTPGQISSCGFIVTLNLTPEFPLVKGTVALQTTQQSSISSKEKGSLDFGSAKALTFPKTVIELLVPSQSQGNPTGPTKSGPTKSLTLAKSLPGYSSFEEFWASTDPSIW